jgi:transcription antitermination factor NusG
VKRVDAALFPGYLFCRLYRNSRLSVLQTPGVHHIASLGGVPHPVDEQELSAIRLAVDSQLPASPCFQVESGIQARIEFGPLAGLEGIVTTVKGHHRLVLTIRMLQRSVAVEIDRDWIRPLGVRALNDGAFKVTSN